MAGGNGGAGAGARPERRWDVALSFAGAQRAYVEKVAAALQARGVRCFYDADQQVRLWGTYLAEELPLIYARESAAVVVFISADYAGRDWTRLERRAAFGRAVIEAGVYVLPARFDDSELPGLLPDVVAIDLRRYSPGQFADLIAEKLADLGICPSPSPGAADRRPPGGVRVREVDLRRLGVHAAISVPGVSDEVLPEYVPRDTDAAESGIRAKVEAAARRGGFVVLVGGSSVGKTRCAAEAVRALLPEWWLVHPAGPAEVAALAAAPAPRTVAWLDELQRCLDDEQGLTGAMVRALLNAPHPIVIIGTLWPDRYNAYTSVPALSGADPHAREREVLNLADVIRIAPSFSEAEQERARAAAARDRRLRVALGVAGYGLTQTLAAAPQLVARWEDGQTASPYAWAVLTAALDVSRLGARAPLSADLLRAAAPGYCTSQQQAEAPDNWFEQALAYATEKLHGAVAALSPVGGGMGRIAGYTAADYLLQHASRERRYARLPASTWDAVLSHIRDPADAARLAGSARNRLLYRYAIPLYQHAASVGDEEAIRRLADLLTGRGDLDGAEQVLRPLADAGHEAAALRLSVLLDGRGDLDGAEQVLRPLADVGHGFAAEQIADLMAKRGDLDGAEQILRGLADAGHEHAAAKLADLLATRGDLDEAVRILRTQAGAGDGYAAWLLADLLDRRGDMNEAEQILRFIADAGHEEIASELADRLADLLIDHDELDEAEQILRAQAAIGDESAALWLADLLANRGDLDGLHARADAGDKHAAGQLADLAADLLADRGDLDGLRARADAGDKHAAERLTGLLADRGDLGGLHARADAGDKHAAGRLAELLADCGDLDELRARADAGDWSAALQLAELLADRDDLDGLRARADAGDWFAARRLTELLADRGDLAGLRARAEAGDEHAAERLTRLLADRGDLGGLRAQADAGEEHAAGRLPELLIKQGRSDEAGRLRRFGLNPDGSIADS
jgi:hypothetical protein